MLARVMLRKSAASKLIQDTCDRLDEMDVISRRGVRIVVRRRWIDDSPVVVKFWARRGIRGALRRALGLTSAHYEWRNLRRMETLGIPAPRSIYYCNAPRNRFGFTEAMVMEDLGDCELAQAYLKARIQEGDEDTVTRFESEIIKMTGILVRGRIIDFDHSMVNIVVKSSEPIRLDLEKARLVPWIGLRQGLYARMIGQLLGTYVFTVQPDTDRAVRFARALFAEVRPSQSVIERTQAHLDGMLERQKRDSDIDVSVQLPREF